MKGNTRKKKRAAGAMGQSNLIPLILIGAGVVLVLAVLIWQGISNSPANTTANNSGLPFPEIGRVTLADSKAALDQQSAVFLDVRDPGSYEAGHIRGAVNIPLEELETRSNELDPNQWIITYCT